MSETCEYITGTSKEAHSDRARRGPLLGRGRYAVRCGMPASFAVVEMSDEENAPRRLADSCGRCLPYVVNGFGRCEVTPQ